MHQMKAMLKREECCDVLRFTPLYNGCLITFKKFVRKEKLKVVEKEF